MATFYEALGNAARSGICSYLDNYGNWLGYVQRYLPNPATGFSQAALGLGQRILCNREPPPFEGEIPFEGGQCEGVFYRWNYTIYRKNLATDVETNEGTTSISGIRGQVKKVGIEDPGTSVLFYAIGTNPDGSDQRINGFGSGSWSPGTYSWRWEGEVVRIDGQPDTCGNPTPIVQPPQPPVVNIPITYTNNEGNNVTIPVGFVYAPVNVNLNGTLSIPVRVDLGGVNFNGDINLPDGEFNIDFGNPSYPPGSPSPDRYDPDPDVPDIPPDVPGNDGEPPDELPEPETIRLLRACIVTVTILPDNITEVFQEDNPNVFIPRLGNVQFAIRVGNRLSWTAEIPVKNRRQFIPCPWEGGAIDVKGTPQPGVSWVITPVYAQQEQVIEFITTSP